MQQQVYRHRPRVRKMENQFTYQKSIRWGDRRNEIVGRFSSQILHRSFIFLTTSSECAEHTQEEAMGEGREVEADIVQNFAFECFHNDSLDQSQSSYGCVVPGRMPDRHPMA